MCDDSRLKLVSRSQPGIVELNGFSRFSPPLTVSAGIDEYPAFLETVPHDPTVSRFIIIVPQEIFILPN